MGRSLTKKAIEGDFWRRERDDFRTFTPLNEGATPVKSGSHGKAQSDGKDLVLG